jgi:glycosyltransferase involved in cell wall biosynthesis
MLKKGLNSPKLLHVTTVPMSFKFFEGQVAYMKEQGFEVHALSSPGPFLEEFAEREQITAHSVEMLRQISPLQDLMAILRLCRRIRKIRPTIVHSHTPKGGLLGTIAAWLTRTPIRIYHIRGLPLMTAKGNKRRLLWLSEKIACLLAHRVLCVSHSIREVAIAEKLCPPHKIKVLLGGSGNGVDAIGRYNPNHLTTDAQQAVRNEYGIPETALVIGFVGRIVRDKGVHELVQAWKVLRNEFPDLHLLVVGMLEPQDPVDADVVAILQNDDRIHLTGHQWDTPPFYAAMNLLVLPTYREGLPNVPLEAAAMRLPVVATRIPGCIDAVEDGVTGSLVPLYDSETLANAIRGYLHDPVLRANHGLVGRNRVLDLFRQEKIWEALEQEYIDWLQRVKHSMPPQDKKVLAGIDSTP